jgi:nicotinamidase-related amidase
MKSTDLRVKPGVSSRLDFPLFPPRTALLIIDVQDHLSSSSPDIATSEPSSHYLFDTALPNAIPKMAKLANTMRDIRDNTVTTGTMFASETNGCEVIITYLEACTIDCRDISLDYKLSGPKLTKLPNPSNKATFETLPMDLQPCLVGRGDILIPKTSCSVFQSTNIRYILSNLGIRQLVICGQ